MATSVDRAYGRAFFRQARFDLKDAKLLRDHGRWAGTVRLAQSAVEKALKAALYVDLGTAVATEIGHYVQRKVASDAPKLAAALGPELLAGADSLEKHVPTKADKRNSEYPYVATPGSATPTTPGAEYTEDDAKSAFRTARKVVEVVRREYRELTE